MEEDLLITMVGCQDQGSGKTGMHVTLQAVQKEFLQNDCPLFWTQFA